MRRVLLASILLGAGAHCALSWSAAPAADPKLSSGFVRVSLPQLELGGGVSLRGAGSAKPVRLVRDPSLGAHSFAAWVPAGEYQLEGLVSTDGSPYLPIPVRAGQMTDLGAIVQVQLGGYESALLAIEHPEATADLHRAQEKMAGEIPGETLVWRPKAAPKSNQAGSPSAGLGLIVDLLSAYDRRVNKPPLSKQLKGATTTEELYRLAKLTVAPSTEQSAVDDQGNLYYGADLGQLRVRGAGGEWRSVDTGTLDSITAVAASGRQLVVGTAAGSIRVSDDAGETWRQASQLPAGDIVIDVDRVGEHWLLLVATTARNDRLPMLRCANEIKVYSTPADPGELSFLHLVTTAKAAPLRLGGMSDPFAGVVSGQYYLVNAQSEVHRLDAASMQWTSVKPLPTVSSIQVGGTPGVITALYAAGMFSKVSASFDNGTTWKAYERPPYAIYDVRMTDAGHGTASRWSSGMFSATLEFLDYEADKKSWKRAYDAPPGCRMMLRDADYAQRFCVTSGGSILARQDGQWLAEFAVE